MRGLIGWGLRASIRQMATELLQDLHPLLDGGMGREEAAQVEE